MFQASQSFHEAIRNGAPQRALLRFGSEIFDNSDINVSGAGLQLTEIINGDTDLKFGLCSSATLDVSLFNDNDCLRDFTFGEFTADIGVMVDQQTIGDIDSIQIRNANNDVFASDVTTGQLTINGTVSSVQPGFAPKSIVIDGDNLYCFGDDSSDVFAATISGSTITAKDTPTLTAHMKQKVSDWVKDGQCYCMYGNTLIDTRVGIESSYEFAPLGVFTATRPNIINPIQIDMSANDKMVKFDEEMDIDIDYPATMTSVVDAVCDSVGIERIQQDLLNGSVTLEKRPSIFDGATKRDVIGWAAEAAACYARMSRDGKLEFVRFQQTEQSFDERQYSDFAPYVYEAPVVDKLVVRSNDTSNENKLGDGENAYLIQNNPFIRPVSDSAKGVNSAAQGILDVLNGIGSYTPVEANVFGDWTTQAGDVVTFVADGKIYKSPVYTMQMTWNGSPKLSLASTGNEKRDPIPAAQRREYGLGRAALQEAQEVRTWAETNIDQQNASIALMTGQINTLTNDLSSASVKIDGLSAEIDLRVEKNGVIAAINASAESGVLIQASKIDLDGYVIMDDFEALQGEVDRITSGIAVIDRLSVTQLLATNIQGLESISGENAWFDLVEVLDNGKLIIPETATIELWGYKPRWHKIDNVVTSVSLTQNKRFLNLMLADGTTTGNIDILTGITLNQTGEALNYLYRGEEV